MTKYVAEFEGDAKITLQAMYVAGKAVSTPKMKIVATLQMIAMGFLAPLGLIAVGTLFLDNFSRNYPLAIPISAFGFGWLCIYMTRVIYGEMARISAVSTFGAAQRVEITPDGFTIVTRNSLWRTSWADISGVMQTKDALCVTVSALALYVPKAALDDPDKVFADMQSWHNASVFA